MVTTELKRNRKGTIILECQNCYKQNFKKEKNLSKEELYNLQHNTGLFCSNCINSIANNQIKVAIFASEFYYVIPEVINFEHIQGIKRAKDILTRGLHHETQNDHQNKT